MPQVPFAVKPPFVGLCDRNLSKKRSSPYTRNSGSRQQSCVACVNVPSTKNDSRAPGTSEMYVHEKSIGSRSICQLIKNRNRQCACARTPEKNTPDSEEVGQESS